MASDQSKEAQYRQHKGIMAIVATTIAIAFSLYHVLYVTGSIARVGILFNIPWLYRIDIPQHLAIHLGVILILVYLLVPIGKKTSRQKLPWYDVVLGLVGLGWNLYLIINYLSLIHI